MESLEYANIASWSLLRSVAEREGDRINKLDDVVSCVLENTEHYPCQQGRQERGFHTVVIWWEFGPKNIERSNLSLPVVL